MKRIYLVLPVMLAVMGLGTSGYAQDLPAQAFENVILHTSDGNTVEGASIVWRGGSIEAAGPDAEIPFDAFVIDGGDSLHVYPGFIDGFAEWASPGPIRFDDTPQYRGDPTYERAGIRPERMARERIEMGSDNLAKALQNGITTGNLALQGYMIPGQLDLFFLNEELEMNDLYRGGTGMQMQFQSSFRVYPGTVMAMMAKLQQMWYDAEAAREWQEYYAADSDALPPPEYNPTLEALFPVMDREQRVFFKVDSKEMIERVLKLSDELGFDPVIVGGLQAHSLADELAERNIPVLASVDFPDKPEWKQEEEEEDSESEEITLTEADQQHRDRQWEAWLAYATNIRTLIDSGVEVGFATADLELDDLKGNLRTLLELGEVGEDELVGLLTAGTAGILNQEATLGRLDRGGVASFSVMTDTFTAEDVKTLYAVSAGSLNEFND